MKNLAALILLVTISSSAFALQQNIQHIGNKVLGSFTSVNETSSVIPVAGNFYAFEGTFSSTTLSCDDFTAQIHTLIADWNKYPDLNLYALSYCTVPASFTSQTIFLYGIDAWSDKAVPEDAAFLTDHQGVSFQGQTLQFYKVTSLDANIDLTLDSLAANGGLTLNQEAKASKSFTGTDQWYPDNVARANLIQTNSLSTFLNFVGTQFGADQVPLFQKALTVSNFVNMSDSFTLHLENGQTADFWLGFGANKNCGATACYPAAL